MAQLTRIGAMIEQKWDSKVENKEKDRDNKKGSENSPGESQEEIEERILLFASC